MNPVDEHIHDCDVCGDGPGVCLTGYLLATKERASTDIDSV